MSLILVGLALLFHAAIVSARPHLFPGPQNEYMAVVVPVGKRGFEDKENRIEIRRGRAVIKRRSFAPRTGSTGSR